MVTLVPCPEGAKSLLRHPVTSPGAAAGGGTAGNWSTGVGTVTASELVVWLRS